MDDAARVFKDLCRRYKPDLITYNTLVTGYARMVGNAALQGADLLIVNRCCLLIRTGARPCPQHGLPARIDSCQLPAGSDSCRACSLLLHCCGPC